MTPNKKNVMYAINLFSTTLFLGSSFSSTCITGTINSYIAAKLVVNENSRYQKTILSMQVSHPWYVHVHEAIPSGVVIELLVYSSQRFFRYERELQQHEVEDQH